METGTNRLNISFKSLKDDQDKIGESLHPAQSLLWVHQEKWQIELLSRYSNKMSLIDATYKTTKYDLPLFFICDVGYSIVAEFMKIQTLF